MKKQSRLVGFGHETAEFEEKGTVVVLDPFEDVTEDDLRKLFATAEARKFAKVVFFPHNEKTLKAMWKHEFAPFHKRVKLLESMLEELDPLVPYYVDTYEEKRKKYTPMDFICRYVVETYKGPYFFYMTDEYANVFSTYSSFDEILRAVRLLIDPKYGVKTFPKLVQVQKRWDFV